MVSPRPAGARVHPILFEIPGLGFPLRSFGLAIALGFVLATRVWRRLLLRYGADPERDVERCWDVAMWGLLGAIAGGRLMYVAVEIAKHLAGPDGYAGSVGARFLDRPWEILFLWKGGLVMYGGFFGAVLLGLRAAKKLGMQPIGALDTGLISGFCAQAVGRIGCLLVGDDYGRVVPTGREGLPLPLELESGGAVGPLTIRVPSLDWLRANPDSLFEHELAGKILWNTQLFMSASALVVALAGLLALRRRRYAGFASLWVFLVYAVNRFAIEHFRGDEVRGLWAAGLSTSQLVSVPVAAAAAYLLWKNRGRPGRAS